VLDLGYTGWMLDGHVVGDWHWHPNGNPTPSPADHAAWRKGFVRSRPSGQPFWLSLLVTSVGRGPQSVCCYATDCDGTRAISGSTPRLPDTLEHVRSESNPDDADDPYAPWNHRYGPEGKPSRLPGGWRRRTRKLRVGESSWWEREVRPGLVQTYYGDVLPMEVTA
jgi:hypothetical protein